MDAASPAANILGRSISGTLTLQMVREICCGEWARQQKALHLVTCEFAQKLQLGVGLDALGVGAG